MKKEKPIYLGERQLELYNAKVIFDSCSLIQFYDKNDEKLILQLDPTELSAIYGSYMQMMREENKE